MEMLTAGFFGQLKSHLAAVHRSMVLDKKRSLQKLTSSRFAIERVTAVTLNLGLLNGTFANVPRYEERSAKLKPTLRKYLGDLSAPDVFCIQELWYEKDFSSVLEVAQECGYEVAVSKFDKSINHGLQILVKKNFSPHLSQIRFKIFSDESNDHVRAWFETAGFVDRGILSVLLTSTNGQTIRVLTTHLTPLPQHHGIRHRQLRLLMDEIESWKKESDHLIVGADLNVAAEYKGQDQTSPLHWEVDRMNYMTLCKRAKLQDAQVVAGSEKTLYTLNGELASHKYSNRDVEQRLDYVLFRSHSRRSISIALDTKRIFDQPIEKPTNLFLSDHFGVSATLILGKVTG